MHSRHRTTGQSAGKRRGSAPLPSAVDFISHQRFDQFPSEHHTVLNNGLMQGAGAVEMMSAAPLFSQVPGSTMAAATRRAPRMTAVSANERTQRKAPWATNMRRPRHKA